MFELTLSLARTHDSGIGHNVAALITDGPTIISVGFNKRRSHPLQKFFSNREEKKYLHAEVAALLGIIRNNGRNVNRPNLYVARALKGGEAGDSYPCSVCLAAIKVCGIKRIFYWEE